MKNTIEISDISQKNLDQIYLDLNILYRQLENIQASSTSTEYQFIVNEGIRLGRYLWTSVDNLSLYSSNETLDDVTTESLKFMAVPAMIGFFYYNQINDNRLDSLKDVKKFYTVFLDLLKDYKFKEVNEEFGLVSESREEKISRFKDERNSKERFMQLEKYIIQDNVDDEIKREYYINATKQWIFKLRTDYKMLNDEIYLLENAATIKNQIPTKEVPKPAMKPFVITSEMVKESVFGMGYKSLPTYSLEEYYIKQVEKGHLPDPNVDKFVPPTDGSSVRRIVPDVQSEEEKIAEREDRLEDSHDIEQRLKAIGMDNYKDEHRRGAGNTLNKG